MTIFNSLQMKQHGCTREETVHTKETDQDPFVPKLPMRARLESIVVFVILSLERHNNLLYY